MAGIERWRNQKLFMVKYGLGPYKASQKTSVYHLLLLACFMKIGCVMGGAASTIQVLQHVRTSHMRRKENCGLF